VALSLITGRTVAPVQHWPPSGRAVPPSRLAARHGVSLASGKVCTAGFCRLPSGMPRASRSSDLEIALATTPLRVAFVGAGNMAGLHLQALRRVRIPHTVAGLCDDVGSRAAAEFATSAGSRPYATLGGLLSDAKPQVVPGRPSLPFAACDGRRAGAVIVWCAERFDDAPRALNLIDPTISTRGQLIQSFRQRGWSGRVGWVPIPLLAGAITVGRAAAAFARLRLPPRLAVWSILRPRRYDTSRADAILTAAQHNGTRPGPPCEAAALAP